MYLSVISTRKITDFSETGTAEVQSMHTVPMLIDDRWCIIYTDRMCPYPQNEFFCDDKSQCVPRLSFCNGRVDCNDRSDEAVCNRKISMYLIQRDISTVCCLSVHCTHYGIGLGLTRAGFKGA